MQEWSRVKSPKYTVIINPLVTHTVKIPGWVKILLLGMGLIFFIGFVGYQLF